MSRRRKTSSISPETESHFVQMMEWLAMESDAEIQRMAERRQRQSDSDAEKSGESLLDLAIVDHRQGLGGRYLITFAKRNQELPMPWHRLKVGSPVVVTDYPETRGSDSFTGVVSGRKNDSIEIALDYWPGGKYYRVDITADEITRRRQLAAIKSAMDASGRTGRLRNILMGESKPKFGDAKKLKFQTELNPSQQSAVDHCVSALDLAIIHGPPGTGKTTTVVEVIIQAVARGEKVLACAPSNTAVDNLLERLAAAQQKVVRIGHPARVSEDLQSHTLDGLVEASDAMPIIRSMYREAEELYRQVDRYTRARPEKGAKYEMRQEAKRLKSDARLLEKNTIKHILEGAHIICATSTFNESLLDDHWFDLLVIDEACQSTEPGCWVPLLRCDKVVLAGDHQQLPPTIISTEAARQGFSVSLMERLMNGYAKEEISRLLSVQYRMHDQIMNFSSNVFYENQLAGHASVRAHLLSGLDGVDETELTNTAVTFIDTAGGGWDEELEPEGLSKRNPNEAALIMKKVKQLLDAGVSTRDIAVIAPYAAQVRLLRRHSKEAGYQGLEIDTVDGFQGREKEAVLITTVRSNSIGEIGFLADARRMNVALTRARRKLVVAGDSATLGANKFFAQMLKYFESIGAYGSIWTEESDD